MANFSHDWLEGNTTVIIDSAFTVAFSLNTMPFAYYAYAHHGFGASIMALQMMSFICHAQWYISFWWHVIGPAHRSSPLFHDFRLLRHSLPEVDAPILDCLPRSQSIWQILIPFSTSAVIWFPLIFILLDNIIILLTFIYHAHAARNSSRITSHDF